MRKKGIIQECNDINKNSLSYKLQQLNIESKKFTGNLIGLCIQPFVTYLYLDMFQDGLLIIPTAVFLFQMGVLIFDVSPTINRLIRLRNLKEEVCNRLKTYETGNANEEQVLQKVIKKI